MSITTVIEEQINEELHKNGDGIVTAWLGDGRWVVVDTEDQSICLVTVQEAEIVPKSTAPRFPWSQPLVTDA